MRKILLVAMFASTSAAAQEFSFDADAMSRILTGTQAIKAKHQGRPVPPMVGSYDARDLSFKLRRDGSAREDGVIYLYRSIEILHKDSLLATLSVNLELRGQYEAERVLKAFESRRRNAMDQKRHVVIDYDAIERQNKAGEWHYKQNPKECVLFDEIIRLGGPSI